MTTFSSAATPLERTFDDFSMLKLRIGDPELIRDAQISTIFEKICEEVDWVRSMDMLQSISPERIWITYAMAASRV